MSYSRISIYSRFRSLIKDWPLKVAVCGGIAILLVTVVSQIDKSPRLVIWLLVINIIVFLCVLATLLRLQTTLQWSATTPFWAAFQKKVVASLHHPHPESQVLDGYLEELEALTLTHERRAELEKLLQEKRDDPRETKDERERAEMLLFIMKRVVDERENEGL